MTTVNAISYRGIIYVFVRDKGIVVEMSADGTCWTWLLIKAGCKLQYQIMTKKVGG